VHLHRHPELPHRLPAGEHPRVAQVAIADWTARLRRPRNRVDAQRDHPLRPAFHERPHPRRRVLAQRIEQARASEVPRPRLVLEAVFEQAMIVLVRFGMHDHGPRQRRSLHQLHVILERVGRRLVRRRRRIRKPRRIEQVDVRLDGQRPPLGEKRRNRRAGQQRLAPGEGP
jgi:hypothetical protein